MTNNEINKIIAEYMGHDVLEFYDPLVKTYTESLDSLIPVISKIGGGGNQVVWMMCFLLGIIKNAKSEIMRNPELSIQQAAAHATARCILELNNE